MNIYISDFDQFIDSIHDYIMGEYEINPRNIDTSLYVGDKSLMWCEDDGKTFEYDCCNFNKSLHVHEDCNLNCVICCTEVDVVALKYLNSSVFGPKRAEIISSLHSWLPSATFQYVRVDVTCSSKLLLIESYLEPSYLFYLIGYIDRPVEYTYHTDSLLFKPYELDYNIMTGTKKKKGSKAKNPFPRMKRPSRKKRKTKGRRKKKRMTKHKKTSLGT